MGSGAGCPTPAWPPLFPEVLSNIHPARAGGKRRREPHRGAWGPSGQLSTRKPSWEGDHPGNPPLAPTPIPHPCPKLEELWTGKALLKLPFSKEVFAKAGLWGRGHKLAPSQPHPTLVQVCRLKLAWEGEREYLGKGRKCLFLSEPQFPYFQTGCCSRSLKWKASSTKPGTRKKFSKSFFAGISTQPDTW